MKPLAGQRILVTRDTRGCAELAVEIQKLGGEAISVPLIELVPPTDPVPVEEALQETETNDWILFTSANAVRFFFEAGARVPRKPRLCAIGPATKAALLSRGATVAIMPAEYTAEGVVAAFEKHDLLGKRILLPRAAVARDLVPAALTELGAQVEILEVYRNVLPATAAASLKRLFTQSPKPHWILFASSSAVKHCLACVAKDALAGTRIASIGPATSAVLAMHGLVFEVEAAEHTAAGLVAAISGYTSTSTTTPSESA